MSFFPNDIWIHILSFSFPVKTLVALRSTCRLLHQIVGKHSTNISDAIWDQRLVTQFPNIIQLTCGINAANLGELKLNPSLKELRLAILHLNPHHAEGLFSGLIKTYSFLNRLGIVDSNKFGLNINLRTKEVRTNMFCRFVVNLLPDYKYYFIVDDNQRSPIGDQYYRRNMIYDIMPLDCDCTIDMRYHSEKIVIRSGYSRGVTKSSIKNILISQDAECILNGRHIANDIEEYTLPHHHHIVNGTIRRLGQSK